MKFFFTGDRREWNVISHLGTQFWKNDQLFKTKPLPLLKILKKLKKKNKFFDFLLYFYFIKTSSCSTKLSFFQDVYVSISQLLSFVSSFASIWQG